MKIVHVLNAAYLMIAAQQEELGGRKQLLSEQVANDLHALASTVNIVAKEEKGGGREHRTHPPQGLLEAHQVVEVAVQVP